MAEIQIKVLESVPNYIPSGVDLDGVSWKISFYYNQYDESWFMDVGDELKGKKIVTGVDLLEYHHHLNVPPGKLIAKRNIGTDSKPSYENFGIGKDITLTYISVN